MHLKNFPLLTTEKRNITTLSPAYDLLSTRIAIPEDREEMALFLNGKKNRITRKDFDSFAENLELDNRAVQNIYQKISSFFPLMLRLIENSFLPKELMEEYQNQIIKNINKLKISV